jgi:hypothetical protein
MPFSKFEREDIIVINSITNWFKVSVIYAKENAMCNKVKDMAYTPKTSFSRFKLK